MEAMLRSLLLDIINIMINGCMDRYGTWSWEHQALRPTFH